MGKLLSALRSWLCPHTESVVRRDGSRLYLECLACQKETVGWATGLTVTGRFPSKPELQFVPSRVITGRISNRLGTNSTDSKSLGTIDLSAIEQRLLTPVD